MDVTKLFDIPRDNVDPLPSLKLEAMIDHAVSYPQFQRPANENSRWFRRAVAVAAVIVIAVTVSLNIAPTMSPMSSATPSSATQSETVTTASADDDYDDVSDLLMMETISDLTASTS